MLWGSVAELSTTLQHHHKLINSILKSLLKLKPEAGKARNVSFSPDSGVTDVPTNDGGLSAEPFFNHTEFISNATGSGDNHLFKEVFFIGIQEWILLKELVVVEAEILYLVVVQ